MAENSLGELLRVARSRSIDPGTGEPYTQPVLADLLDVAVTTVSSWERGATNGMKPENVNAIAKVLPVTVAELCRSMGYAVEEDIGLTDDERRLLRAFRRLRSVPILQQGAIASMEGTQTVLGPHIPPRPRRRRPTAT